MVKLSPHFTLDEFISSQTALRKGIDNVPDKLVITRLINTAEQMEVVRALLSEPIVISSGYRSPDLNAAIGGSKSSQHMLGEAADFVSPWFGSPLEIANKIKDSGIEFDQLIYEGTWIHISFLSPRKPRREILTWRPGFGYSPGINN